MHVNSEELVLRKDKTRIEIGPNFILTISSIRILMQMSLNISLGAKLSSAGFVVNQTMTTNYLKQTLIAKKKSEEPILNKFKQGRDEHRIRVV